MKTIIQFLKEVIDFFFQLYLNRNLIRTLSWRDFEKRYIRNFFGLLWAILDPLAFVVILYVVFGARYGNTTPGSVPFVAYLLTGYIAFDLFSVGLPGVTNSINENSFLLKKINFRVAILPIVAMLSDLMIHGIVLLVCIVVLMFNKVYPDFYWVQLVYYIFSLSVFLISLGWFTSSVSLFFPDIRNIINIITRIMFFLTPIFWKMEGVTINAQHLLKLNPLYYIVNGYRDSLLTHQGFWTHPMLTLYFWLLCLIAIVTGVIVFKKLRPHFADVVA